MLRELVSNRMKCMCLIRRIATNVAARASICPKTFVARHRILPEVFSCCDLSGGHRDGRIVDAGRSSSAFGQHALLYGVHPTERIITARQPTVGGRPDPFAHGLN